MNDTREERPRERKCPQRQRRRSGRGRTCSVSGRAAVFYSRKESKNNAAPTKQAPIAAATARIPLGIVFRRKSVLPIFMTVFLPLPSRHTKGDRLQAAKWMRTAKAEAGTAGLSSEAVFGPR
jgi:hypothetical protein